MCLCTLHSDVRWPKHPSNFPVLQGGVQVEPMFFGGCRLSRALFKRFDEWRFKNSRE